MEAAVREAAGEEAAGPEASAADLVQLGDDLEATRSELEATRSELVAVRLEAGWSGDAAGTEPGGAEAAGRRELLTSPEHRPLLTSPMKRELLSPAERRELAELRALLAQHGKHLPGEMSHLPGEIYMGHAPVQGQLVDPIHVQLRDMGLMLDEARGALAAAERRHATEVRRLRAEHAAVGGEGAEERRQEVPRMESVAWTRGRTAAPSVSVCVVCVCVC